MFNYMACEPFIFDTSFKYDAKSGLCYNDDDDITCDIKNNILRSYYIAKYKETDYSVFMLNEYFGIGKTFSYNNQTYSLVEFIESKDSFYTQYTSIFLERLILFYEENADKMSPEDIIVEYDDLPIDISSFDDLAWTIDCSEECLRLISTDLSDSKSPIDLKLYNMFHYGESDAYISFPYMETYHGIEHLALLNQLKNSGNKNNGIDEIIFRLFKEFPAFSNARMMTNQEANIVIYKDKTLILIAVKSTFGSLTFEEKLKYEKDLICTWHQLNKALGDLQANAELLYEITESDSIKFDDLKIETMIVSNVFEFDGKKFQGHRKISLLELMIILRDDANDSVILSPKIIDLFKDDPNSEKDIKDVSLYSTDNPSIEDFLKALNSGVFEKVLGYWK